MKAVSNGMDTTYRITLHITEAELADLEAQLHWVTRCNAETSAIRDLIGTLSGAAIDARVKGN